MRLDEARPKRVVEGPPAIRQASSARQRGPALRRASTFSAAQLARLRLRRSRALLLAVVGLGILVAVVLICTVPLFNSLVGNVQLQTQLRTADPLARNIEVRVQSDHFRPSAQTTIGSEVPSLAQRFIQGFTDPTPTDYLSSDTTALIQAGNATYDPANQGAPDARFYAFDMSSLARHAHLLSGTVPTTSGDTLITAETAKEQHLAVNDTLTVAQFGDHTLQTQLRVTGIWTPTDANDAYWNGLSFEAHSSASSPAIYPLVVTRDTFAANGQVMTGLSVTEHWVYFTAPSRLTINGIPDALDRLTRFQAKVSGNLQTDPGVVKADVATDLISILNGAARQQQLLSLPLYIIVAQVIGLALLFVTVMSGLLVEGQSQDIATLKSRGVSAVQILGAFATQGALLGIVAVLAGPFLAAFLGLTLARTILPASALNIAGVTPAALSRIVNPSVAVLPALVGAALGVLVVAGSAWQAAQLDVLTFRREQARPSRQPLWRRLYLDVALALLCIIGYVELGQFGTSSTRLQVTAADNNPLLLVTPALLLLAGALLVLRLIPLGASLGERLAARRPGAALLLAFAQVRRNPGRYSRLTLLLVLAVGLGLFTLTFDASLAQNINDRETYAIGTDVRVSELAKPGLDGSRQLADRYQRLPGVTHVSPAVRTQGSTTFDVGTASVDVLAIDPSTFQSVAGPVSWQNSYASQPLSTLLGQMRSAEQGASAGALGKPVQVIVSRTFADRLHVRVGDSFTVQLADVASGPTSMRVGTIIDEFPTLYPTHADAGFLVLDYNDYNGLLVNALGDPNVAGANEFWLRTNGNTAQVNTTLDQLTHDTTLNATTTLSLRTAIAQANANPVSAGMRGLLLVGAATAAALAVLASLVQSVIAARQRTTQFAILRTLGMGNEQLSGLLLGEQLIVYAFGLVGGTVLGLILTTATLPFLQFSDTTVDASRFGVPAYRLVLQPLTIAEFYAILFVSLGLALLIAARYAARVGLGKALRLGED